MKQGRNGIVTNVFNPMKNERQDDEKGKLRVILNWLSCQISCIHSVSDKLVYLSF